MFNEITAELLRRGSYVRFRAIGASMQPTIEDGELITVAPVAPESVKRGDILLYQNERGVFAHRVVRVVRGTVPIKTGDSPLYLLRGDASVSCDPPVMREQVIGRVVAVQRGGRSLALDRRLANLLRLVRLRIAKSKAFRLVHLNYQKCIKNS
jgi:signal peptidase I